MYLKFLVLFIILILKVKCDDNKSFPEDFQFGVATASYQIEGGWNADGKGENIWDAVTHQFPNWTADSQNADIACNSYNQWQKDVKMVKSLKVDYYRFSLSWPRILPTGHSNYVNREGVSYYNSLIDELLKYGIEPVVTLYHWDLPQNLQHLGGWTNLKIADYFENYAYTAFKLFGDRVKKWITINEPFEICEGGYGGGRRAPRLRASGIGDYLCGKTILLAHGKAYRNYYKNFKATQNGTIGITISAHWFEPKSKLAEDVQAAERIRQMNYGWWLHPILSTTGNYPKIMIDRINYVSSLENYSQSRLPKLSPDEIKLIRGSYDFLGLNHYTTKLISNSKMQINDPTSGAKDTSVVVEVDPSWPTSAAKWMNSVPWGFRKLLNWIRIEYNNPLVYITENGFGDAGGLLDSERVKYHKAYLEALLEAIQDGCNVKAYFAWSLMDNMEWEDGYTVKFGLYKVNFTDPNRPRTMKESGNYFKWIVKTRKIQDVTIGIEV